jgi:hypothetical protein
MTRFLRERFLRGKTPNPAVHLGAFGKHPAWHEHIIGLSSHERLVWLKDSLYERGIRGNIDSGEWKRLEDAGEHQSFGHLFLWHQPGELLIGRLWESTDFNARPRYPMVVCAVCQNVSLQWVMDNVAPRIAELERRCRHLASESPPKPTGSETTRARAEQQIVWLIEEQRRQLDALAPGAPAVKNNVGDPGAIIAVADHPDMGPQRKGLYNLAFQVDRVLEPYRTGAKNNSKAPQRLRVPPCSTDPAQAAALWMNVILSHIDPAASVLIIVPESQPWLDIIVGQPGTPEFVCLRASTKAIPLTTDIAYPVDGQLIEKVNRTVDAAAQNADISRWVAGGARVPSDVPTFFARPASSGNQPAKDPVPKPSLTPKQAPLALLALLGTAALVAGAIYVYSKSAPLRGSAAIQSAAGPGSMASR